MTAWMCSLFSIRIATVSPSRRPAWRKPCASRLARASSSSKVMTVPDGCRMTAGLLAPVSREVWGRICMAPDCITPYLDGCHAGRWRRADSPSGQQQGAVAEFMPQIAVVNGLPVRRGDQVRARDGLQQQQVRGAGIVPSGDQAVDHPARVAGPSTRSVQPTAWRTTPSAFAADSRARVTVVPTAITRPPAARVRFTIRAVAGGTSKQLRDWWLARLRRRHPGVQGDRRDRNAVSHQSGYQFGAERPRRTGHFSATQRCGRIRFGSSAAAILAARTNT